ncbi:hypothetical protein NCER_102255 [Vairimorpha ceranae BRL01]|uniref:MULE transposase domain-containing protein n=1 Tax=Vairimorpha ceranae (strain BRL01) TaxID=578460 RepID=C4VBQ5_VAIC1|nr:hypothetical protein NCER_102255 [Vairimorpha ceranae BRL01]
MIQNAATWVCDGTFKSAPSGFSQVFIIHFSYHQEFMLLLYVLLPGKSLSDYNRMICEVKSLLLNQFKIKNLICDFEISIRLAFKNNFPGINISHCLFHFGQILWRNLAKNHL